MMRRPLRVLAALALGACGDDDAGAPDTVATSEADATSETTTTETAPEAPEPDTSLEVDGSSDVIDTTDTFETSDPAVITPIVIAVGDLTFEARTVGPADGELVLFLHGFPATSAAWTDELEAVAAAGYRAVAFDQRGYSPGARPEGVAAYTLPNLVADVLGVADALGAARFHLVGHDWGAAVAWTFAALHPDRLHTLTALSVPHPAAYDAARNDPDSCQASASGYIDFLLREGSEDTLLAAGAAGLRIFWQGLPEATIDAYLDVLGTADALGAAIDWYRANLGPDAPGLGGDVGDITPPTLFIWGDADPAVCEDGPSRTAPYVTGPYRFEVLAGLGHWLPELAAAEVGALMLEHLAAY